MDDLVTAAIQEASAMNQGREVAMRGLLPKIVAALQTGKAPAEFVERVAQYAVVPELGSGGKIDGVEYKRRAKLPPT